MTKSLTRNEIGLLALALILMVVAHWHWLPISLSASFIAMLVVRLFWATWMPGPVPMLLRAGISLAVLALLVSEVGMPIGREGGSALLICLLALKLLETQSRRDARLLLAASFFTTMVTFLFSQQIIATVYALFVGAVLFAAMHGVTPGFGKGTPGLGAAIRQALPLSGRLAIAAVPLTLMAFAFFPRLSSPLWGAPWDARTGKTGISDRMEPGAMSGLWNDDTPVMRAVFEGPLPTPQQRYWRGPVLWDFDGTAWLGANRMAYEEGLNLEYDEPSVLKYSVMMEPTEQQWLFPLDLPVRASGIDLRQISDGQTLARRPVIEPKLISFSSATRYRFSAELPPLHRMLALRLPRNNSNPRARAYGEELKARHGANAVAITDEILSMIRRDFTYTLEPPPLMMDRPIDDFLFQTKEGYCEHFSSAYVYVMRAAGIPARVVTGYLGGVYNSSGDYLLVRNSDAHAWAEYWAPGEGWVRVDPTGAVAPERINQGTVDAALPDAIRWYEQGWLGDLGMRMDWVSSRWRQLIIEYDANRQRRMLEPMGFNPLSTSGLTIALGVLGAAALALGVWWSMLNRNRQRPDKLGRAWKRFLKRLERHGLAIEGNEGPNHLCLRAKSKWPQRAAELETLFAGYIALRYGHGKPDSLPALVNALKRYR